MNIYLYDGSFEGLMTAIYAGYYEAWPVDQIIDTLQYVPQLMDETKLIYTDHEKSERVVQAIQRKLKERAFQMVLYAFLSEHEKRGTMIYRFLRFAFKVGPQAVDYLAHQDVTPMWDRYRAVARESHRMVGLVRFVELQSAILYSQYESDYNLVPILGEHFHDRLRGQPWILHDMVRQLGAVSDGERWYMRALTTPEVVQLHDREIDFQMLWQTYFKHIAIRERENKELQRSHMPKKYWKYLVEINPLQQPASSMFLRGMK